jgi:hypothetical protein
MKRPNQGAAANSDCCREQAACPQSLRGYAGQLDDFMKFDCQACIQASPSAAVAELGR